MRNRHVAKIPWSRPLGDFVQSAIGPVLTRRGFSLTGIVLYGGDFVAQRPAPPPRPIRVQWRARHGGPPAENGPAPAALVVRVETACALEFQHLAPVVIERVNA